MSRRTHALALAAAERSRQEQRAAQAAVDALVNQATAAAQALRQGAAALRRGQQETESAFLGLIAADAISTPIARALVAMGDAVSPQLQSEASAVLRRRGEQADGRPFHG